MSRNYKLLIVAMAVILMTVFAMFVAPVSAQGPTGSQQDITLPKGVEYSTVIPGGSELSFLNVVTNTVTFTVTLSASTPFNYSVGAVEAPAYSSGGPFESAPLPVANPYDAVIGSDKDVTAKIISDNDAKFTVVIAKSALKATPTPTAAPVTPTVKAAVPVQVYDFDLKKDTPVTLGLVIKDGDKIGVFNIVTGTVTMTLKSGAPFAVDSKLEKTKAPDGLVAYEYGFNPPDNQNFLSLVEGTVAGQQVFVSLMSDTDTKAQLHYQPAKPAPVAPAAAPTAKPGVLPKTSLGDNPESMSWWDAFVAWITSLFR